MSSLADPALAVPLALVVGLLVGSFLNVVIHRLPRMMERQWLAECEKIAELGERPIPDGSYNLMVPGSRCPRCGHRIRAWENVPVLSWLALRGRCSECGERISARYPLVELLAGAFTLLAIWRWGISVQGVAAAALLWALLALAFIDLDEQYLPDSITVPLAWAGLLLNWRGTFTTLESALWGAVAGYLSLWLVYWIFKLVRGKEGMGYGDFKLLAALGAWLGWQALPDIIFLSSVVGALVGIALIATRGRDRNLPMPFGPYLAAAGALVLFVGPGLVLGQLRV